MSVAVQTLWGVLKAAIGLKTICAVRALERSLVVSATTYEDCIGDGWLALAAAIISKKELSVTESLHLIGLRPIDINDNVRGVKEAPKHKNNM